MSMLLSGRVPDLAVVPAREMLAHLRPRSELEVRTIRSERVAAGVLEEYQVSGQKVGGAEVLVSLRLLITDPRERRVVFSLPGGAGAFAEVTLLWLGKNFGGNHAVVDWVGRGRSPRHESVECRYDPIWLGGDSYRDAYLFHNIAAIWAAYDWLHGRGLEPDAVVGGSWGGVFCLLLAALDPRVARVYATFGCGGFSIPGIEKRSMWDAAFAQMGAARTAEWCRAFDPLLRAQDVAANVYFETATNDKFVSLDMAMATWSALPNRNFLALRHNQDHTMNPFGQQPYAIEAIERAGNADMLAPARAMNDKHFSFMRDGAEEICWPVDESEYESARLAVSEQLAGRGDMSREWRLVAPRTRANRTAAFPTGESAGAGTTSLFYLTRELSVAGRKLHAATPVHRRECEGEPALAVTRDLLPDPARSVWEVPIGDKTSPMASNVDGGFGFAFTGAKRQRTTRFGIRPWLLPRAWQAIEIECGVRPSNPGELWLFLSARYNQLGESSVVQRFADAEIEGSGDGVRMRFARSGFVPSVIIEQRFGPLPLPDPEPVLEGFDAIGVVDPEGRCTGLLELRRMSLV